MERGLENPRYNYDRNDHVSMSGRDRDYGDVPRVNQNPKDFERAESLRNQRIDVQSTSGVPRQYDYTDDGYHRRNDDYYNYHHHGKDRLGWNALMKEGWKAWQALFSEFLGVLVLVFVGCGSCVTWSKGHEPSHLHIAFAFGTARATIVTVIGHISGSNVNPAVTVGLYIGRKITPVKALFYIFFQVLGACAGAALLNLIVPLELGDGLGQTHPNPLVTKWQALIVEAVITFMLTLTVFAVNDELRSDIKGAAPLVVGFVIMTCHLMAIGVTGSSMNPARSTGPAIIKNNLSDLWIYWVGPCAGSIIAGLLYIFVFHKEEVAAAAAIATNANNRSTAPEPDPQSYEWKASAAPIQEGINTTSNQSVVL